MLLVCWIIFPLYQVTVELGVIVQHHQDEHHTGEDVGEDVSEDDGEDDLVETTALLLWTDGHWEVLRQLDDQRDAGGHTVEEGQDVHLEMKIVMKIKLIKFSVKRKENATCEN